VATIEILFPRINWLNWQI